MAIRFPKTVGGTADALYKLRAERLTLQKKVDALKSKEAELGEHALGLLASQRLDKGSGKLATISRGPKVFASVEDWDKLYTFIEKNDAFDMLQRRLNNQAVLDRLDAGQKVPVKTDTIIKLSLSKAGAR